MGENKKKNSLVFILTGLALAVFIVMVLLPQSFWVQLSIKIFP